MAIGQRRGRRLAQLGPGSEERLRWLLDFVRLDLAGLNERDWTTVWSGLFRLIHGLGWGSPPSERKRKSAGEIQQAVRGLLENLANGRTHPCNLTVSYAGFKPPPRRPRGGRVSGRITRMESTEFDSPASAVVLRTVDLLDEVGADRLRACAYHPPDAGPCGRLFLATRRQVHCSPDHARKAAWLAYVSRPGTTEKRKQNRA